MQFADCTSIPSARDDLTGGVLQLDGNQHFLTIKQAIDDALRIGEAHRNTVTQELIEHDLLQTFLPACEENLRHSLTFPFPSGDQQRPWPSAGRCTGRSHSTMNSNGRRAP